MPRASASPAPYEGLDRLEARRRIVADLEARGDLVGTAPHEMVVGRCQRSDDVIEPRLKTQWFMRMEPLAAKALAAVRDGRTRIVPRRFEKVFFGWLEQIHDWNLSRQLWWGHRIPAWYCPDGHVTVSELAEGPAACAACGRPAAQLEQDPDIFDTWFSSGLWPFSTLGWPAQTADLARYYPGSVMETGYDIIFFWVARMMMLGEWLTGQAPFEAVYLSGLVRDPYGQKMSKTKGNVVDPLGVVDEHRRRQPALRAGQRGRPGRRPAALPDAPGGRPQLRQQAVERGPLRPGRPTRRPPRRHDARRCRPPAELGPAEHWLLADLARTIDEVTHAFESLQLGDATRVLHEAIWSTYCDQYLELAKARLADPATTPAERAATWRVLVWALDRYLRLLHPVMPFLTEAIWQRLPHAAGDPELLIVAAWPDAAAERALADPAQAAATGALLELVRAVRNARAEAGIAPAERLAAELSLPDPAVRAAYAGLAVPFGRLTRLGPVDVADGGLAASDGAAIIHVLAGTLEAALRRSGADVERDRARVERELADTRARLAAAEARLTDGAFTSRAPASVVEGARARAAELREQVDRLEGRLR